MKIYKIV